MRVATRHVRDRDDGFATEPVRVPMTIRHLLTFTSGIGPGRDDPTDLWRHWQANGPRTLASGSLADRIDHLATLPLFENPGTRWRYGWSADVLARVVEVASGQAFDTYLQAHIFAPLGMTRTRFLLSLKDRSELASVYTQDENGELVPVTPESDTDFPEGGSGLVSSASDYLRFALMLWNEGEYRGTRVLRAETVRELRRLHVPTGVLTGEGIDGMGWGLGVAVTADAQASRLPDHDGDVWWAGYLGSTFFVSPDTGLVGVLLSQNEPGPHSDDPIAIYVAQALAFAGL
jgi:CubicO group peptidase (beta-lactamase class C family)